MENLSLLVAFGAGLISFLSPCMLPLVPVYMGHLAGHAVLENSSPRSYLVALPHAVSFVLGFAVVLVGMGIVVGLLGVYLAGYMALLRKVAGALLMAFGLYLVGMFKLPFLDYERRLQIKVGNRPGYARSFLVGTAFSLGWTPCVGPILGGILALAWTSESAWQGAYLLSAYSLGLGLPFIAVGIALGSLQRHLKRLNRHLRLVSVIAGLLLIAVGVLIFTNKLVWLNQYFDFFNLGKGV